MNDVEAKPGDERTGVCPRCKQIVTEVFTADGKWHACEVRVTTRVVTGKGEVSVGRISHSRMCLMRFRRR